MAEIHLSIDDAHIVSINRQLKTINEGHEALSASEMGREAFGLYDWAITRMAEGFTICAVGADGKPKFQAGTRSTPVQPNPKLQNPDSAME